MTEKWASEETRVYFGDGGFDLRGAPDAERRARLIAAAPDMLEALEWFIQDIDGTHTRMIDFDANVERARNAIAKARGGA